MYVVSLGHDCIFTKITEMVTSAMPVVLNSIAVITYIPQLLCNVIDIVRLAVTCTVDVN